ncbi:hypothetical protein L1887_36745 [Cichorium endivia]|nr:hypothetical protein L1887_36745 [Cichorium endivia]
MESRPPDIPPEGVLPPVIDISPSILGRARRDKSSPALSIKLNPQAVIKKPVSATYRRSGAKKTSRPLIDDQMDDVTIPPVLSTLIPSAMSVGSPSSPIGEFSILGCPLSASTLVNQVNSFVPPIQLEPVQYIDIDSKQIWNWSPYELGIRN